MNIVLRMKLKISYLHGPFSLPPISATNRSQVLGSSPNKDEDPQTHKDFIPH